MNPLVVIENYPEDLTEEFEVENNPEMPERVKGKFHSLKRFIERDDFMIDPPSIFQA